MRAKINALTEQLQIVLSPQTHFNISIHIDGYPDPNDVLHIGLSTTFIPQNSLEARLASQVFHLPTVSALESDFNQRSQSHGSLELSFWMSTAMYCVPTDNGDAVRENRAAIMRGEDIDLLQPWEGRAAMIWRMAPTADSNSYRGFMPFAHRIV